MNRSESAPGPTAAGKEAANQPTADQPAADQTAAGHAYLVVEQAGRWSDVYRLHPGQTTTLGRARDNAIVVRTEAASRHHAEIARNDDRDWVVRDLGSRNGTVLNGQTLDKPSVLCDGDRVCVGGLQLRFASSSEGLTPPALRPAASASFGENAATGTWDPRQLVSHTRRSGLIDYPRSPTAGDGRLVGLGSDDAEASLSDPQRELLDRGKLLSLSFEVAEEESLENVIQQCQHFLASELDGAIAQVHFPVSDSVANPKSEAGDVDASRFDPPLSIPSSLLRQPFAVLLHRLGQTSQPLPESIEMESDSVIFAPILRSASAGDDLDANTAWLHVSQSLTGLTLDPSDLQLTAGIAELLAIRREDLSTKRRLQKSLKRSQQQVRWLKESLGDRVRLIGKSESMARVIEQVRLAAPTPSTILIRGESGVGKELIAKAIHLASPRSEGPLVCMNCAALSPSLLESELFGHEKGAFTGATERQIGKFEAARGGTILLDEVGEMPAEIQAKFLRVLEGHSFERVGGHQTIQIDVRVVAATNRDLREMVDAGQFREDLYYRLHVVEFVVPPLRDRGSDVIELANHFVRRFAREMGRPTEGLTKAAQKKLRAYRWPGNIRELRNVIERAVVLSTDQMLDEDSLLLAGGKAPSTTGVRASETEIGIDKTLAQVTEEHIDRVLRYTEGNKSRAAQMLGIERSTLDRRLKRQKKAGS